MEVIMKEALTKGTMVDQLKSWGVRKGIKEGVGEVPLEHLKSHDVANLWQAEYDRRKVNGECL